MPLERVVRLLSGKQNSGVAMKNIQARLMNLCGSEFTIGSMEERGTEVVFAIPAEADGICRA
jgi:sensor histidine kinase YesM